MAKNRSSSHNPKSNQERQEALKKRHRENQDHRKRRTVVQRKDPSWHSR
ncbi:MAG: hypothetical protein OXC64_02715 [Flavobacteriaceae bacterium]|nr:hypothetical protein [Flavobacteriaceae bacterium]